MIQHDCFGREWIDEKRAELRIADPGLLEKCIHALQLLGRLAEAGGFDPEAFYYWRTVETLG